MSSKVYQGLDLAPNHWAIVEIDEQARLTSFVYLTDVKGSADKAPKGGAIYRPRPRGKKELEGLPPNVHAFGFSRLDENERILSKLFDQTRPTIVGLEDYAHSAERGAHLLGENQGPIRLALWRMGIECALFGIQDVKLYAAHDGNASKEDVIESVWERWGEDFERFDPPKTSKGKPNIQTSGDLADAYVLARLARLEDRLRCGAMTLADLEHEKEVQIFQRATKSRPLSRLGQDRLQRPVATAKGVKGRKGR